MRAELWLLALAFAAGCGAAQVLTRPEGNGGWSPERRTEELQRRATAAAVSLDPGVPPATPEDMSTPLSLSDALALATTGNRRIAEAEQDVDAAAARVRQTRGLLLPATTGSGRFTRYSSELRNAIALPAGILPSVTSPSFVIREKNPAQRRIELFGAFEPDLPAPLTVGIAGRPEPEIEQHLCSLGQGRSRISAKLLA